MKNKKNVIFIVGFILFFVGFYLFCYFNGMVIPTNFDIELIKKEYKIEVGSEIDVDYKIISEDDYGDDVLWNVGNSSIAEIKNGKIIAKKVGKTSGTIKLFDEYKKFKIVVYEKEKPKEKKPVNSIPKYEKSDSLKKIAKTYYDNEARGNACYLGKKVKTSGIIEEIMVDDGILFNTGVTIFIKAKGAKYSLMCNNDNGIKGVIKYNRGDKITVVGKMDTKSYLSLRMSECEIYEK